MLYGTTCRLVFKNTTASAGAEQHLQLRTSIILTRQELEEEMIVVLEINLAVFYSYQTLHFHATINLIPGISTEEMKTHAHTKMYT